MDRFNDRRNEPLSGVPHLANGLHAATQPKTWFGKLVAAILGVAVLLVALFLSIFAFAVIAIMAVLAVAYILWTTRRARRAAQSQIIDNEAQGPGQR